MLGSVNTPGVDRAEFNRVAQLAEDAKRAVDEAPSMVPATASQNGYMTKEYAAQFDGISANKTAIREPEKEYALGVIVYNSILSIGKKLVCVKPGITAAGSLTLSDTTEGAIVTDGSVVWIVDSLADGINTAAHKNGIYRGANLTAYWDSGYMSANIQAGVFVGMYIGDYITKSITVSGTAYNNLKWLLAGFDSHLHSGDTETTAHHVVITTENVPGKNIRMNATNVTTGGFVGSEMWTTTLPKWATGIKNAFGAAHILKHRELLTNSVSASAVAGGAGGLTGTANNWAWTDVEVNIPNEPMVYGGRVFGGGYDVGDWPRQLPLFALMGVHQTTREWFWLRAVASSTYFSYAHGSGNANYCSASSSDASGGLRPISLLR